MKNARKQVKIRTTETNYVVKFGDHVVSEHSDMCEAMNQKMYVIRHLLTSPIDPKCSEQEFFEWLSTCIFIKVGIHA